MADVCDIPVISAICTKAGDTAGALVAAPFEYFASTTGGAAAYMFEGVWALMDTTTMVDITSGEFTRVYSILFGVAVFVMLGFFLLQVMGSMIRREPAGLSRAVLGLAKSILGSFVVLTLLAAALEITDRICVGIVLAAGTTMDEMGERIFLLVGGLGVTTLASPGVGVVITIFLACLAISAAVIVWISLLVRKALLLVAIVFAPIALSGASWDVTRGWVGKWAALVLALIVSKVVLVVIFLLATAQVSAPITTDLSSVSDPMAGIVLMLVAGFAPYMTYKAISFMGFDMYQSMSTEQEAKSALNRPVPIPTSRRGGSLIPKVLNGSPSGTGQPAPSRGTSVSAAPTGGAGGSGAAGGGGAAAGGVAAGVVVGAKVAKGAATAGVRTGQTAGAAATGQAQAAQQSGQTGQAPRAQAAPPQAPPPRVADPIAGPGGGRS